MDELPDELVEYLLCKRFGWTITELYEQPAVNVQKFITIMNIEQQAENNGN